MQALYLKDSLALKEIPVPVFGENEALVKVKMAGICNTDLELVKGYMGFEGVLGHEFVGVVEKAANQEWVGKRICGEINFGCAECLYCRRGLSRHCPTRTVMGILNQNGAFAEYVVLPIRNLHEIPESIPNSSAVFVEPLAAALEILEQIKIEPNCEVAVIGDGKLGLLICQVLRLTGCRLKLIGKHPKKLVLAQSWGISTLKVDEMEDRKYDFVVEASGSPSGFASAMQLVRPRGTLVLKSTYQGSLELNAAPIVIDEITIVGSRCGPFEPAIRTLENNLVKVDALIDQTYPFSQALQAFEHAKQPGSLKIILDFDE
ncbi:alcohol dehydrogenase catalytic domain-containing protein [candidate division KSB1 bacterium]|nr:alcohol dehydrogenase catalytic domain-containing protein [candidate division KSB1 bacterium]